MVRFGARSELIEGKTYISLGIETGYLVSWQVVNTPYFTPQGSSLKFTITQCIYCTQIYTITWEDLFLIRCSPCVTKCLVVVVVMMEVDKKDGRIIVMDGR